MLKNLSSSGERNGSCSIFQRSRLRSTMYFTLLTGGISLFVLFRLLHIVYSAVTSPLRSIPGPFLARFTKLWYLWRVFHGHFERDNTKLHRKYSKNPPVTPKPSALTVEAQSSATAPTNTASTTLAQPESSTATAPTLPSPPGTLAGASRANPPSSRTEAPITTPRSAANIRPPSPCPRS